MASGRLQFLRVSRVFCRCKQITQFLCNLHGLRGEKCADSVLSRKKQCGDLKRTILQLPSSWGSPPSRERCTRSDGRRCVRSRHASWRKTSRRTETGCVHRHRADHQALLSTGTVPLNLTSAAFCQRECSVRRTLRDWSLSGAPRLPVPIS
ncbi:hypothetical protein EXIGLDRAFT_504413 [Exidia glandulosa HHB12029]|uniref:Uncharacterized protein n=1 Tax=Exidia glandulosa HHB12029 TaxID=1314781 RepID=A0A166N504_EXIGL|nr:hypothetical protein EXIGLDRAFT_504413 [Exidia glandulosa HHB12029]